MNGPRLHRLAAVLALAALVVHLQGCRDRSPDETLRVSLKNTDTYQLPTVGGDEDGARITTQARHFRISEIRRGADTHWVATYVYQPAAGFVGSDYVEIEIRTGSDGASPPTHVKRVAVHLDVHD
jgi:hypothetical protein